MSTPLRVGIDVTAILYNRGVSRYTSNIVRSLAMLEDGPALRLFGSSFRSHKQLRSMISQLRKEQKIRQHASVLAFPPSFLSRMWYGVGRLHIESLMPRVDVFHAWEELIPPSYKTPIVATIHDLAIFKFPELAHPETKEKHTQAIKRLLAYNSHVIAVSTQTKRDLLELFSFSPDKVHVIPEAVPEESLIAKEDLLTREQLQPYGIVKPYLLWVGTNEPRKNIPRLLQAWRPLSKEVDLVLAGGMGLKEIAHEPGLKLVISPSHEVLASLYAQAEGFVFPSLYEGFGLPILEAFYYGCPVVTAKNSGMQEVGDGVATLVDPYDVDAITHGIRTMLTKGKNASVHWAMQTQVEKFSWERSAMETYQVYTKAHQDGFHPL